MEKKQELIKIIKELQKHSKKTEKQSKQLAKMGITINNEHTEDLIRDVIQYLDYIHNTNGLIRFWIQDLDYGKKYKKGCFTYANGKEINISTASKLYDYITRIL